MGLTSKRMKFIFKKFLDFEKAHGNDESVEKVKELAGKYVEKASSSQATCSLVDDNDDDDTSKSQSHGHGDTKKMQENLKKNLNL